jgi:hypothetical protein
MMDLRKVPQVRNLVSDLNDRITQEVISLFLNDKLGNLPSRRRLQRLPATVLDACIDRRLYNDDHFDMCDVGVLQ